MTNKEQVFQIISGDEIHHFWDFLIRKGWQPQFAHFQDVSYFMAYNGHSWYKFNDPTMPESPEELRFNMSVPFNNQEPIVYDFLLSFLDQI